MIELCTKLSKRRMIISIIGLGVLTVVILILEEKLTSDPHWNQSHTPAPLAGFSSSSVSQDSVSDIKINVPSKVQANDCWTKEDHKVITECDLCSHIEINSGSIPACTPTGLKETIHCNISGTVFRSCSVVPSVAKTRFWIFESLMLLTASISFGLCHLRNSQIQRATIKQIERRLASGM